MDHIEINITSPKWIVFAAFTVGCRENFFWFSRFQTKYLFTNIKTWINIFIHAMEDLKYSVEKLPNLIFHVELFTVFYMRFKMWFTQANICSHFQIWSRCVIIQLWFLVIIFKFFWCWGLLFLLKEKCLSATQGRILLNNEIARAYM